MCLLHKEEVCDPFLLLLYSYSQTLQLLFPQTSTSYCPLEVKHHCSSIIVPVPAAAAGRQSP